MIYANINPPKFYHFCRIEQKRQLFGNGDAEHRTPWARCRQSRLSELNSDVMDEEKPACSVVEQAGVPRERVIGGLRDRKGLFYLLTLESIGLVSTENVNLIIINNLFYRVGCIYIIDSLALNEQCRIFCITGDNYCSRIILNAI